MALAAYSRTVHHVPVVSVQSLIQARREREAPLLPVWDFELLTMEVVIYPYCLRESRSILGGALVYPKYREKKRWDFGPPSSPDLGGR